MAIRDLDAKRRRRTLDELESVTTQAPSYDSYLLGTSYRLRKKPIGDFTVEDLRLMIGQNVGLFFLIPIALDVLGDDPLVAGDYFPGDLLYSVLRVDLGYWQQHADQRSRLDQIVAMIADVPKEIADALKTWTQGGVA